MRIGCLIEKQNDNVRKVAEMAELYISECVGYIIALCSPFATKSHLKVNFRTILLQMCIICSTFAQNSHYIYYDTYPTHYRPDI